MAFSDFTLDSAVRTLGVLEAVAAIATEAGR